MSLAARRFLSLACGLFALAALGCSSASAGVLTREALAAYFPDAIRIGDKDTRVPVWPIIKLDGPTETVVAYAFESIDLAPIPGFAGEPFNLLILLDRHGEFREVRVLSQHEPVFLDGLGEEPLLRFVEQYAGKNLRQNIKIGTKTSAAERGTSANAYVDGIAKATASVKIVNQTVLAAALKVARAKLGFARGRAVSEVAQVREDLYEPLTFVQLVEKGWVRHVRLSNGQVDAAFKGTAGEGLDTGAPGEAFIDLWYAYLNAPAVGRNLLGDEAYARLKGRLEPGQHALWAMSAGRYSFVGDTYVRGAVPDRLALRQAGLPIDLRDMDLDLLPETVALPPDAAARSFRVIGESGFDPSLPWTLDLRVTRKKGLIYPEVVNRDFDLDYALPKRLFSVPDSEATRAWKSVWKSRTVDLVVLVAGFAVLVMLLARPGWLCADMRRLSRVRWAYLAFTLLFVGWYAQAQLSIVNLAGLVKAARNGWDFTFYLYDPATLLVAVFALASLVVWGRGTFCGWLCPFGVMQEVAAELARRFGIRQWKVGDRLDRHLGRIKYGLLAAILVAAAAAPQVSERLIELEPFKTAVTLTFVRSWPYVAYAVALLLAGAVVYKAFCRYLCPLGAGLALLGRVRRLDWLARRSQCGKPCQLCRHRCHYRAIDRNGAIRYEECFQCLDCVAIYRNPGQCAPLMLERRRAG